jgi:hypothetical protein
VAAKVTTRRKAKPPARGVGGMLCFITRNNMASVRPETYANREAAPATRKSRKPREASPALYQPSEGLELQSRLRVSLVMAGRDSNLC